MQSTRLTATDALYSVFDSPRPSAIRTCPVCLDEQDVATLVGKQRQLLTPCELASFASSCLAVEELNNFQYFLPRILEISATDKDWYPSPEVVIGRLREANWKDWPAGKQAAIRNFLLAWLKDLLGSDPIDPHAIDDLLCGIGRSGEMLESYLKEVFRNVPALAAFWTLNFDSLATTGELQNPFWRGELASGTVIKFLASAPVKQRLAEVPGASD